MLLVAAVFSLAFGLVSSTSSAFAGGNNDNRGNDRGGNSGPRDPRTRDGKPKYTVHNNGNDGPHDWNREHGNQQGFSQIVREYHMDETFPLVASMCGVNFVGTTHITQDFILRGNGKLYFKYYETGSATGTDAQGHSVELTLRNYEIDLIVAETPPDLGPYGGVLKDWVNDHLDIVIDIKSQILWKLTGSTGGPQLLNDWVFHATHTGVKLDQSTFQVTNCPPFLDSPTPPRDDRDHDGYDRNGRDREGRDRDGRDRNGDDRNGNDRNGNDRNGRHR